MTEIAWSTLTIEQLKFLLSKSSERWVVDGDRKVFRPMPKHLRGKEANHDSSMS